MLIVASAVVAPYKAQAGEDQIWLETAEEMTAAASDVGVDLLWFLAAETTGKDAGALEFLFERITSLSGTVWKYDLRRDITTITTDNRAINVDVGRNLCNRHAVLCGADWMLSMDTDIAFPIDTIPKLLELGDHPCVAGHVPEYALSGPRAAGFPEEWDVQEHWTTAGFLMIRGDVCERICWRRDSVLGLTDDPCYQYDVRCQYGTETRVRHDLVANHIPPLVAIEDREYDLTVS